ncbi:hypothetical protein CYMTET_42704 [Cymbomonas tetramitiformis]|uniref:Uncharacterized protein n=1 Tax=Cymbomonas tetramitiformis TaxID=36881 RepID=A0AAE0F0Z3_9CHLO|nr:hypothetical protein CYMTET_42704 [Cymbomonas tetramitiformis]
MAEAGTYHLPDDNSDAELKETEENLTKLASSRPDTGVDPTAGRWGQHEVKVLVDTRASGSFTSETVAQRLKMRPQRLHETTPRAWGAVERTTPSSFGTPPRPLSVRLRLVDGNLRGVHAGKRGVY